jgi:hypothetical protein
MAYTIRHQTKNGMIVKKKVDRRWMMATIRQQQEVINTMFKEYYELQKKKGLTDIKLIIPVDNPQAIADITSSRTDRDGS